MTPTTFRRVLAITVLGLVGVSTTPSHVVAQSAASEEDDIKDRVAAFREARADASGHIASDAWARAWKGWRTLSPPSASTAADASWRALGPYGLFGNQINFGGIGQLVAGRVTSISVSPTDPQTIYIGAAAGGVWKSTTGGASWSPLTDAQCSPAIGSVAIDPVNPSLEQPIGFVETIRSSKYRSCTLGEPPLK